MERGGFTLRCRVIESIRIVFVTVVWSQFIEILLQERVSDSFEPIGLKFCPKMVGDRFRSGCALARSTERGDRGPVGTSADGDFTDVLSSMSALLAMEGGTSL